MISESTDASVKMPDDINPCTVTWLVRPIKYNIEEFQFNRANVTSAFPDAVLSFKNSISLKNIKSRPKVYFTGTVQLTGRTHEEDEVIEIVSNIYRRLAKTGNAVIRVQICSIMANYSIKTSNGDNDRIGDLVAARCAMDDSEETEVCVFSKPHQLIAFMKRPVKRMCHVVDVRLEDGTWSHVEWSTYVPTSNKSINYPTAHGKLTVYSNGSMNVCSPSLCSLKDLVRDAIKLRRRLVLARVPVLKLATDH